jgi:hypothetical protein
VVDEEHLESLDFMLWMSGSHRASRLTHTNQSTVIRRARTVLSIFGTEIHRSSRHGWRDQGGTDLLQMERVVHQRFRFRGRRLLRLHSPYWSQPVVRPQLPRGWMTNPADPVHTCENPLELLRQNVIDACLVTPTQIEHPAEDLVRIDLVHSVIDLTIFAMPAAESSAPQRASLAALLEQAPSFQLELFDFLPRTCREISRRWFETLFGPKVPDTAAAGDRVEHGQVKVAFLTPEMRGRLTSPFLVDPSCPRSYRESLVVLRDNAGEPRFLELLAALQSAFCASPPELTAAGNRRKTQDDGCSAQP